MVKETVSKESVIRRADNTNGLYSSVYNEKDVWITEKYEDKEDVFIIRKGDDVFDADDSLYELKGYSVYVNSFKNTSSQHWILLKNFDDSYRIKNVGKR